MKWIGVLTMAIVSTASAAEPKFSMKPGSVVPGSSYVLTVTQNGCEETGLLANAVLSSSLSGIGLTPSSADAGGVSCKASWKLDVAASTLLGATSLVLQSGKKDDAGKITPVKLLDLLELQVTPVAAGPIPPGLNPQVDVMWKIMPWKNTSDSFGRKVANQYFCVHIMVGNNTGYAVQFSSLGFRTQVMKDDVTMPPIPNDPYNFPRSTIEKDQLVGKRALVLHSLEAASGILTGAAGFVHNKGHSANYNMALGLANPVEAGFNVVWPDRTVRHLVALDTRGFRDGIIVANNVPSPPIIAFVSRELVECPRGSGSCGPLVRGITRVARNRSEFNPNEIMNALGELVLAGQPIQYLPRINVSGNKVQLAPVPPVVNPSTTPSVAQGGTSTVTFTGNGLQDVKVAPDPDSGLSVAGEPVIDPDGKSIRITLTAGDNATPGASVMTLSNAAGVTTVRVNVAASAPKIDKLTPETAPQSKTAH